MRRMMLVAVLAGVLPAAAQRASAQVVRFGTIGGGAALPSGLHESALGAVLQLQPVSGLTFDVRPTWARVAGTATTGTFSSSGFTDLPLDAGFWRSLPGPLSPGLGASLGVTLPVGDTAKGLGSGQASVGGSLGGSLSPTDKLSLGVDAWREFSGSGWSSALSGPHATSLSFQATYDVTEHANLYAGVATDVGTSDSLGTPRSLLAGLSLPIGGRVALNVDGAHGLTSAAPSWVVSIGVGTAFAGINPIGANSPVGRLATALGHGVNRGRGRGNVGGTKTHGRSGT